MLLLIAIDLKLIAKVAIPMPQIEIYFIIQTNQKTDLIYTLILYLYLLMEV